MVSSSLDSTFLRRRRHSALSSWLHLGIIRPEAGRQTETEINARDEREKCRWSHYDTPCRRHLCRTESVWIMDNEWCISHNWLTLCPWPSNSMTISDLTSNTVGHFAHRLTSYLAVGRHLSCPLGLCIFVVLIWAAKKRKNLKKKKNVTKDGYTGTNDRNFKIRKRLFFFILNCFRWLLPNFAHENF